MKTFKATNADLECQNYTFVSGKTHTVDGEVVMCKNGFHSCLTPFDILNYYPITSRFWSATASGQTLQSDNDSKICSQSITLNEEISLEGLIKEQVRVTKPTTTGDSAHSATTGNHAHSATTGDRAHSATTGGFAHSTTTGYRAHSATTGDYAHSTTTGYRAHSTTTGKNSVSMCAGKDSVAKSNTGITLCEYNENGEVINMKSALVLKGEIEAGKWYKLTNNEFIEVQNAV